MNGREWNRIQSTLVLHASCGHDAANTHLEPGVIFVLIIAFICIEPCGVAPSPSKITRITRTQQSACANSRRTYNKLCSVATCRSSVLLRLRTHRIERRLPTSSKVCPQRWHLRAQPKHEAVRFKAQALSIRRANHLTSGILHSNAPAEHDR